MPVRVLQLNDRNKARVSKVVAHSKKKRNWYLAGPGGKYSPGSVPGRDKRHCCQLDSYRCVFSYTCSDDKVWRHLSVSVDKGKSLPHPAAVHVIAHLFGFSGSSTDLPPTEEEAFNFPTSWLIQVRQDHPVDDDCIVIAEDTGLRP
jgi:hypothetical protein